MRKRVPWVIEQKELEAKGYKFNDRGEMIEDKIPVAPISVAPIIQDIIQKQESKSVVVKKQIKNKKGRK